MSKMKYTPAAPFAEAINEWLARYASYVNAQPYQTRQAMRATVHDHCIRVLSERSGLHRDTIRRVADGTFEWLTVRQADRLSMGLDVPLRCLTEDFRPMDQWLEAAA